MHSRIGGYGHGGSQPVPCVLEEEEGAPLLAPALKPHGLASHQLARIELSEAGEVRARSCSVIPAQLGLLLPAGVCAGGLPALAACRHGSGSAHRDKMGTVPPWRGGIWQLLSLPGWIWEPCDTGGRRVPQPLSSWERQSGHKGVCPFGPAVPLCLVEM